MQLFLVVLCFAAAAAVPQVFYHQSIGVPEAARIKLTEDNATTSERVAGGWDAWENDYPFMGGLLITLASGETSVCGSALLSNTRLLTAAHCWWDGRNQARQLTVVLGSLTLFSGGTRVNTSIVQMHANWNPSTLQNNIAIASIPFVDTTASVQPVRLPTDVLQGNNNFAGMWGIAVGFGRTTDLNGITPDQTMSRVNLPIITNAMCEASFGSTTITASSLCTSGVGGVGVCGGDTGGPLVVAWGNQHVLVGVTSFGLCQKNLPSVFSRVTVYEAWIRLRL